MDDFKQLRHLVALNDHSTLREAAESLGITKSALSQSIRRIEDMYGAVLFERSRRGVKATYYGSVLVEAAKRGLDIFQQAQREFNLLRNLETGRLTVGSDPIVSEVLLSPTLAQIMHTHPDLQFTVKSGFWADQEDDIRSGAIDLYVGVLPDGSLSEFCVKPITLPGMFVFCRSGHPLTKRTNLRIADIYQYPVVSPYMPDWFYYRAAESRRHIGRDKDKQHYLLANDAGTIRDIVKRSDGVSGGFYNVLASDLDNGSLVILPIFHDPAGTPMPGVIVTKRDRILPPLAQQMIETLADIADALHLEHIAMDVAQTGLAANDAATSRLRNDRTAASMGPAHKSRHVPHLSR